jgi:hypothetical protein
MDSTTVPKRQGTDSGGSSPGGVESGWEEGESEEEASQQDDEPLNHADGSLPEFPAGNFASEMHFAAVPKAPRIYVPPESLYG